MNLTQVARTLLFAVLGSALMALGTAEGRCPPAIDSDTAATSAVDTTDLELWVTGEDELPGPPTLAEDQLAEPDHFDTGPVSEDTALESEDDWFTDQTDSWGEEEAPYRYEYPEQTAVDEDPHDEGYYYNYGYGYEYADPEKQYADYVSGEPQTPAEESGWEESAGQTDTVDEAGAEVADQYDLETDYWSDEGGYQSIEDAQEQVEVVDVVEEDPVQKDTFDYGYEDDFTDDESGYQYYDYEEDFASEMDEGLEAEEALTDETATETADDSWQPDYSDYSYDY
ncbi:MAG TPA: hypothetical protein EYP56_08775, partial [Planctomycetaceae bacterium]|nr:hypothetical protein [Planctomycetaceae bacterium]